MPGDVPTRRRKLAAILMADVSGFSAMMGRDEERTTELIRDFHERVLATVEGHEGRVVDTAGDSVFGEFDSVVNAVRCAQRIQEDQDEANAAASPEERILTRIGVHLGDVIVEEDRVYGDGVNIAARLEQAADPGGILVSEAVYQQIHNKLDLGFADLGPRELRNIERPVRLYRVTRERTETVIETRPQPPLPRQSPEPTTELAGPLTPVPSAAPPVGALQIWMREIVRAGILVPVVVGVGLLLSDLLFVPSGGALPTVGAILLGAMLGGVWARLADRPGNRLVGLGLGIMAGALLTGWGPVTNYLFVLGGLAVVAWGVSRNFAPPELPKRERRRPRRRSRQRQRRRGGHGSPREVGELGQEAAQEAGERAREALKSVGAELRSERAARKRSKSRSRDRPSRRGDPRRRDVPD